MAFQAELESGAVSTDADSPGTSHILSRFGWRQFRDLGALVHFRGHVHGRSVEEVVQEAVRLSGEAGAGEIGDWLDGLDGHFSLVLDAPGLTLAASDPVRTYPLLWGTDSAGQVRVGHHGPGLLAKLGFDAGELDADMVRAFTLSGFTIGNATLHRCIRQIGPGEFMLARGGRAPEIHRYHRWTPWEPESVEYGDLLEPLAAVNRRLIEDLIASARGRSIVVPLSAGLDSRFIAAGLVEAGYANVKTFSYGLEGNREAETAREIARRLGVDWTFVPYSNRALAKMFASDGYRAFMDYSDSLTSIHFPQDYYALDHLRLRSWLPEDAIMVNGQTGDFIAGNHVPASLAETRRHDRLEERQARVIDALIAKHYKHWRNLVTPEFLAPVRRLLASEIDALGGMPGDPSGDHGIYEYCEFQDRQSKYVVNGQRLYEFMGLDWRLPIWERRYLDFWEKAPLEAKLGERLYRDVLVRENWGNVWQDIPVNPTRIRPGWIRPVRLAAKAALAPFGKAAWHDFEKRYLDYFMATTSAYSAFPYGRVARDRRGHYSAIGWHIEAYLNDKGLAYDGAALDG